MIDRNAAIKVRGFILVHDTLCNGIVPAERDARDELVVYRTRAEAELERVDAAEMSAEALRDVGTEPDSAEDGPWTEAALILSDGTLILPDLGSRFSPRTLNALLR